MICFMLKKLRKLSTVSIAVLTICLLPVNPVSAQTCGCQLGVSIINPVVRPGDDLGFTIHLQHNRDKTVTKTISMWIEDGSGAVIASKESEPLTIQYHDVIAHAESLMIPTDAPPGKYHLHVTLAGMLQGVATTERLGELSTFDVISSSSTFESTQAPSTKDVITPTGFFSCTCDGTPNPKACDTNNIDEEIAIATYTTPCVSCTLNCTTSCSITTALKCTAKGWAITTPKPTKTKCK